MWSISFLVSATAARSSANRASVAGGGLLDNSPGRCKEDGEHSKHGEGISLWRRARGRDRTRVDLAS
eukprot:7501581-Alexandrium_andersonii.AAC.1